MFKNTIYITTIILISAVVLSCFYNTAVIPASREAFIKNKWSVYLDSNKVNEQLDLKKDTYLLRLTYPLSKNQEKTIYLNETVIAPSSIIRGENEVDYVYLTRKMISDGHNLLRVNFAKSYPRKLDIRITNYYAKLVDSIYIIYPDSVYCLQNSKINKGSFLIYFLIFIIYWSGIYFIGKVFSTRLELAILFLTLLFVPPLVFNLNGLYKLVLLRDSFWALFLVILFLLSSWLFFKKTFKRYMSKTFLSGDDSLKNYKVNYIGKIILFGFVVSVIFHLLKSLFRGFHYPNNTFLFVPGDRFNDFFNVYDSVKSLDPYNTKGLDLNIEGVFRSIYYPFANIISYTFTLLPKLISLILYLGASIISFLYFNASNLKLNNKREYLKNFLIFSCLSYPFLFAVDRANIEFLLFIFLYLFVYFDQKKYSIISVVFLSFAIAMKAFPAVFLLLLLSEKKYKEMILAVTLSVFFTFVALLCFKGGVSANLNYMLSGFNVNTLAQLSTSNNVLQRGVSLFTLFKLIFIQTNYIHKIDMVKFLSIYTKIIFSVFIVIGYYVVTIEREFWKKVMVLVSAMLLFPHVSVDYKLLYLFIPLFLFINYPKNDKYDLFYIITFALLLIPKDYFIFPNVISEGVVNDISIAVVLNIVLIFAMMFVIIIDGSVNRSKRLRTYDS